MPRFVKLTHVDKNVGEVLVNPDFITAVSRPGPADVGGVNCVVHLAHHDQALRVKETFPQVEELLAPET